MRESRDWFWVEVLAVLAMLVGGAGLRFWLSTAVPFDAAELEALADASVRNHSMRMPFIMFNGASLFALYLFLRRSAGVPAAFAGLLLLQTSLDFQQRALRIGWLPLALLVVAIALTLWRFTLPARRAPHPVARALALLAVLLAGRGLFLGATLPQRLAAIRRDAAADPALLQASLVACGGTELTPLDRLADCDLAWPKQRSLAQQEALFMHAQRLGGSATVLDGAHPLPDSKPALVAIFDPAAVALFAVEPGPQVATALKVVGTPADGEAVQNHRPR